MKASNIPIMANPIWDGSVCSIVLFCSLESDFRNIPKKIHFELEFHMKFCWTITVFDDRLGESQHEQLLGWITMPTKSIFGSNSDIYIVEYVYIQKCYIRIDCRILHYMSVHNEYRCSSLWIVPLNQYGAKKHSNKTLSILCGQKF